jgi:hypothetical protein
MERVEGRNGSRIGVEINDVPPSVLRNEKKKPVCGVAVRIDKNSTMPRLPDKTSEDILQQR